MSRSVAARIRWKASRVASVPEFVKAPQRLVEAPREILCHDDRVLGRLGEVGTTGGALADGADERRMGVADEADSVPTVKVDVLVAIEVVDLGALAVADPHRLRLGDHPTRGRSSGQRPEGANSDLGRARLTVDEDPLLFLDELSNVGLEGGCRLPVQWTWCLLLRFLLNGYSLS